MSFSNFYCNSLDQCDLSEIDFSGFKRISPKSLKNATHLACLFNQQGELLSMAELAITENFDVWLEMVEVPVSQKGAGYGTEMVSKIFQYLNDSDIKSSRFCVQGFTDKGKRSINGKRSIEQEVLHCAEKYGFPFYSVHET